ncbi:class I SAM-dependent methyltransferase [Lysinibacillus piscis]|uniref:Class I SAM-dependent methyltransferase n=1 Tax=Lysinibacillus piscis TaxID=2518931 RepID=A0ABQ5NI61_9BACI|nr:class I SAM-dependent methyltransferase [Lysinibacillus sp. KH24]GLC87813.1 hypothetical protein LYSBPC_09400 [Lysinibacillus sp. KH24]
MEKILLFGASKLGEIAYDYMSLNKTVVGFIDNDEEKWGKTLKNIPIYPPNIILESDYEVIIASSYVEEIRRQLNSMGFNNYSIFNITCDKNGLGNSGFSQNNLKRLSLGRIIGENNKLSIGNLSFLNGSSLITDYLLLRALMYKFNLKNYLEIGTWTGESIMSVSDIAEKCYSISLPDDDMLMIDIFKTYCDKNNFSRFFSKDEEKIISYYDNSLEFDFSVIKDKIDLVFIDGDHSYEAIYKDSTNIFELVGFEDTIIVWHDFKSNTNQLIDTTYNAILTALPKEFHENLFAVDTGICGVYLPKKYNINNIFDDDSNELFSYKIVVDAKRNYL